MSLEESIIYSHGHQLVMYAARNTVNEYDFGKSESERSRHYRSYHVRLKVVGNMSSEINDDDAPHSQSSF